MAATPLHFLRPPTPLNAYHDSIADALADLGKPEEIASAFTGFQKYLYPPLAAA